MWRLDYGKGATRHAMKPRNTAAEVLHELRVNPWGDRLNREVTYVEVLHILSGWGYASITPHQFSEGIVEEACIRTKAGGSPRGGDAE